VHAFSADPRDGSLTWLNSRLAPGPRPTFLSRCWSRPTTATSITSNAWCAPPRAGGPSSTVFALGDTFEPGTGRAFVTCEFSSELASFSVDPASGDLRPLDRVPTVASGHRGRNEPAEVRVHPGEGHVYVNNRGEDPLAWFRADHEGRLLRLGHVPLARSVHPGLAARSFAFDPTGTFLLLADRRAGLVRSFAVDAEDGRVRPLTTVAVTEPSFVAFAEVTG